MEIKRINIFNILTFTDEEIKALETVYNVFDKACHIRKKDCDDCPLDGSCPLYTNTPVQAMKNFITKMVEE